MNSTRADFFAKIAEDPELQKQVDTIQQTSIEAAAEALSAIAREAGYSLTSADFLPDSGELAEDELAGVSGGATGDVTLYNSGGPGWQWQSTEDANGKYKWAKVPVQKK